MKESIYIWVISCKSQDNKGAQKNKACRSEVGRLIWMQITEDT